MTFDELCEAFVKQNSFMEPQVTGYTDWWAVEDDIGDGYILEYDTGDDILVEFARSKVLLGYGARLSAPGYLDCTDWTVFDTEQEAIDHLEETYLD